MEGEVGRGSAHLPSVREQVPEEFADPDHEGHGISLDSILKLYLN
jgi:hypothetical protein